MLSFNGRHEKGIGRVVLSLVAAFLCLMTSVCFTGVANAIEPKPAAGKKGKMSNEPVVVMETTKGTIKIQLFTNEVPTTANNFQTLVSKGFYNGLTFHRYEPGFVIQGGDPKGDGTGGYIDPATKQEHRIPLEVKPSLKHDQAGMVAMARANDPNSASYQFYITLAPASFLDMNYAVFGKVIDGLQVVSQLRKGDKMTKVTLLETANR
jgi:cyclophilin family peptidyl-prolyl cis-trans isomerase